MIISNDDKGYPSKWSDYSNQMKISNGSFSGLLGLGSNPGDINRFAARFRAANCFAGLEFEGYSEETQKGYSALCQVVFTWSAFETLLKLKSTQANSIGEALRQYGSEQILANIKNLDVENKFYRFIHERVNSSHQRELDNYFNDDPSNIAYLASAIRHIFAHGILTPNVQKISPNIVVEICRLLCEFLMTVMDEEFTLHYEQALREIRGQ
ncbi:hypothetical protein [Nodosilinea sp. E11]|uniref:hypothetical protein n=1 Tax=Nodosilinea sp. E11 TaxID=3037479 RepID=UPI002934F1F0|nr:hypothetical protein [Nodosilinea sp. E11]WOD41911.1 hypothetical protein RRF56_14035 [Nodosilinea sp. E11]